MQWPFVLQCIDMRCGLPAIGRSASNRIDPTTLRQEAGRRCLRESLRKLTRLLLWFPVLARAQFDYTTNNGTIAITGYTGSNSDVTIPSSITGLPVTSIGNAAFTVYPSLTSIIIPDSVTSIGQGAFTGCGLTNVTIPNSITNIGSFAFEMSGLTNITVDPLNSMYSSSSGVLFDKGQTTLIQYPGGLAGTYAIPSSVISIGEGAFYNCGLTGIVIPDRVTSIGDFAFNGCTNLANVVIGNGITVIEGGAFSQCTGLTNVAIGNNVISIGDSAFYGCAGLTSITIPASVTSIGQQTFNLCVNLASVYFQGNAPGAGSLAFSADPAIAYYLPGTTGWGPVFANLPTAPWTLPYPLILNNSPSFGVQSNQFGFTVSWATNLNVVVEATTDLANPVWSTLGTNTLSTGFFFFSDPQWTNYPTRFYRIRSF
jgi:hypothetical protein